MTLNTYYKGGSTRLKSTFTGADVATDPTAAALIVREPDGVKKSYLTDFGFTNLGSWDADGNSPALADGTGAAGQYYSVSVAGTVNLGSGAQTFAVGDRVFYDGDVWLVLPAPQATALTKESTGVFYFDQFLHEEGSWYYRFEGSGAVHAVGEKRFDVRSSKFR